MESSSPELLVYKASAGSGKTFTLTVEYIKLLIRNPRAYRQILAVTFTNKATSEMKKRILGQLYGIWTEDKDSEPYLKEIVKGLQIEEKEVRTTAGVALSYMIHDYSQFRVETIDSFFQSVMRNLAKELELSPNLNIELNNTEVLGNAVDSMIEKLNRQSPVMTWLMEFIDERIQSDKRWNVSNEIKNFGKNILDEKYIERGEGLRKELREKDCIKNYRTELQLLKQEALEQQKGFYDQFIGIIEDVGLSPTDFKGVANSIGSYFNKQKNGVLSDKVRNKTVENCLESEDNWASKDSPNRDTILAIAVSELIPLLQDSETYRKSNNRIVNSCKLSLQHINTVRLLTNIDEEIRELNRETNTFLLSDTNTLLHNLVREGDSSFVFEKIGANIRNVMIDEFQDTSHLQWSNFKLLLLEGLAQGANSLIVGDVKQSIYRWRSGDWSILDGLKEHIEAFPINVKTLTINRRSESNIIRFNNEVFTAACACLCDIHREELGEECKELVNAYSDVCQQSPKETAEGYVKVSFLGTDEEKPYVDYTIDTMGEEIKNLIENGISQKDITILVRKNKSIPLIADYFDKHFPFKIVSDEAFQLDASLAVCMIINGLRYLSNPADKIAKAQLAIDYQTKVLCNEIELNTILLGDTNQYLPLAFTPEVENLRLMPLYDLTEKLFVLFEMDKIKEQDAYLFAFFDATLEYLQTNSSEIDSFIAHWENKLHEKTIPSGEIEGIRILSIHKAKGLEFHTVLFPFCDWKLENEKNNQLVWCAPTELPFSELDLVPINYSSTMAESIYRADYLEERLQLWIDSLNLLYVAFTRATKNLIIYGKKNTKNTVSELLFNSLTKVSKEERMDWDNEETYELGEIYLSKDEKEHLFTNKLTIPPTKQSINMLSLSHQIEFKQSNQSADFISGDNQEDNTYKYINKGQLLHTLFSNIKTLEDIPNAIEQLVFQGIINSQAERQKIEELTQKVFSNPTISEWYAGNYQLFNECAIIYKENGKLETRRPDRVMMNEKEVIVVDFKFGKENDKYKKQVQGYIDLLSSMGYKNIKGYLWYVYENKISLC
ncbi:MAG: UvrD-helicase domain-containing protein [Bacteroidaceae bacterium]